jgi:hypothetical protein
MRAVAVQSLLLLGHGLERVDGDLVAQCERERAVAGSDQLDVYHWPKLARDGAQSRLLHKLLTGLERGDGGKTALVGGVAESKYLEHFHVGACDLHFVLCLRRSRRWTTRRCGASSCSLTWRAGSLARSTGCWRETVRARWPTASPSSIGRSVAVVERLSVCRRDQNGGGGGGGGAPESRLYDAWQRCQMLVQPSRCTAASPSSACAAARCQS